jgi:hypothetical protein
MVWWKYPQQGPPRTSEQKGPRRQGGGEAKVPIDIPPHSTLLTSPLLALAAKGVAMAFGHRRQPLAGHIAGMA